MKVIKFMLSFDQEGKGFAPTELYKDIHTRLINKHIATNVVWGSDLRPPLVNNDIVHVEIPYTVKNDIDPDNLTISNIKKALDDLLVNYKTYSNLLISNN